MKILMRCVRAFSWFEPGGTFIVNGKEEKTRSFGDAYEVGQVITRDETEASRMILEGQPWEVWSSGRSRWKTWGGA
jgi:hypothetical protein